MDPSGKSPHADRLREMNFVELSESQNGDIWLLNKDGAKEQKLSEGQSLLAALVTFALAHAAAQHPKEPMIYINMEGVSTLTGVYDYGHFWITGGRVVPEGFTLITSLIVWPRSIERSE